MKRMHGLSMVVGAVVLIGTPVIGSEQLILEVEKSEDDMGSWETAPVTNRMLTSDGKMATGVVGSTDPVFYRLRVLRGIPLRYIRAYSGSFTMGSPVGELGRNPDEVETVVSISSDLIVQQSEVTNCQMADVLNWALGEGLVKATTTSVQNAEGSVRELLDLDDADCAIAYNGSAFVVEDDLDYYPCVEVTWYGAQAYCNFFSDREGISRAIDYDDWSMDLSQMGYRLPTEAEWEYCCRAGTTTAFYTGPISHTGYVVLDPNLDTAGWYLGNSGEPVPNGQLHPVGQKKRNGWYLYDTHGNVSEWVHDWYGAYPIGPLTNPTGPSTGSHRVLRGGGYASPSEWCRSASRGKADPGMSSSTIGFRPVRTVP